MIQKSAMTGLTRAQALFRFNQAKTRPGAVVEMIEQSDGKWTVTIIWDDGGTELSHDELSAFAKPQGTETVAASTVLGALSKRFESNNNPGAIGFDSTGGFSYGSYQIASKVGRMQHFIDFLKKTNPDFASALDTAGGDGAARDGAESFRSAWRHLAINPVFGEAQHDFIATTHYEPFAKLLLESLNLDLNKRSSTLRDVAWSVAVQHGPANKVFAQALDGTSVSELLDREIVSKVYAERAKVDRYFASSNQNVKLAVAERFKDEMAQALAMLA